MGGDINIYIYVWCLNNEATWHATIDITYSRLRDSSLQNDLLFRDSDAESNILAPRSVYCVGTGFDDSMAVTQRSIDRFGRMVSFS